MSELASKTTKDGQKLLTEEYTELLRLQEKFKTLTNQAGNITMQKMELQLAEKELEERFLILKKSNQEFFDSIKNKYGIININIETGEYVKTSQQ